MSLEKVCDILQYADKNGFIVPAFNAWNFESIAWAIEAAQEENTPVIVMLYPGMKKLIPFSTFSAITKDLARKAKVPVGLHLDHCSSYDEVLAAIAGGFTSVMVDGSKLDYEGNIKLTADVVRAAHAMGVDVEAELGKVGSAANADDFTNTDNFTKVSDALEFVERTSVDTLAVAIGSAHGTYVTTPKLDFQRLEELNKAISIPLVLHGGTGIPDEQLQKAAKLGINKLNIGTEYFQLFMPLIKGQADKGEKNFFGCLTSMKPEAIAYLKRKLNVLKP